MKKIRDLEPALKELALRRQFEYRSERSEDYTVNEAINWDATYEGLRFWSDVYHGEIETIAQGQHHIDTHRIQLQERALYDGGNDDNLIK